MLYIGPGICDPDHKGFDAHGVLRRFGYVGSGVIYGVLAFAAASTSPARKTPRMTPWRWPPWPTNPRSVKSWSGWSDQS